MQANSEDLKNLSRLKNRRDFLTIRNHNLKYAQPGIVLQVAPAPHEHKKSNGGSVNKAYSTQRYGITVSSRVDKRAAARNRIKRRLRSVARDILPSKALSGYDYVLIGRKGSLNRPYADLKKDLEVCLGKLGALKERKSKEKPK